jgi:hypothetical protein
VTQPHRALKCGRPIAHDFNLRVAGEAWAALTLAAPGTSWQRGEAAVVSLEIDGGQTQHVVLAGADEPVEYARLLGRLAAGAHRLVLGLDASLSAASARAVECRSITIHTVADDDPAAFVWRHAPVLHYRHLDSPFDGATTDTPLLVFHRSVETPDGSGVEYHVINSHEDAGTNLTGLLARWGHTTDIEWVFRIIRDRRGRIVREAFQGAEHATLLFRGARAFGGHPVLQVATRNGMVTDRRTSPYRTVLAPVVEQPPDEPREGVQYRFPWIHRVSALEVLRQEDVEREPRSASAAPADPRAYVYLQFRREGDPSGAHALEALADIRGARYGSAWGRPDLAMRGEDAESTAIKLPPGAGEADVDAIAVRAMDPPAHPLAVRFVRAFCLDDGCRPRAPFAAAAAVSTLSAANSTVTVWVRRR